MANHYLLIIIALVVIPAIGRCSVVRNSQKVTRTTGSETTSRSPLDGTTDTATLPLPTAITESPSPEVTKTKEESSTPVVTTVPPLPSATTLAPSLETTTLSNDVAREDRVWWKLLLNTIWTGGKPAFIIAEHVFAAFGVLVLLVIFLKRCSVNKSADNYVTETDSLINDQRRSWSGRRNQRTYGFH